jgi:murein DD-endopeptidase MepM/ murein hydrolase activator NlpD
MILISHGNGYSTVYAHLSKQLVKAGDQVKKGDLIGKMGSTGRSTGPHLHFEIRENGTPIDPQKILVK